MMYEVYERPRDVTMFQPARNGLCLDLKDPKKSHPKEESQRDVLTTKDMGMLELTSPELERMILDPLNDRFLGRGTDGFGNGSFYKQQQQGQQPQSQPGHGSIAMDQLRHQPNLPAPAQEAVVSSDEESDMETRQFTYTNLVPKTTIETGFSFNPDTNPGSLRSPSNRPGGCCPTSLLPTAVHPGESYLPLAAFRAVSSRLKEEPMQLVPCLDGSPASSLPPMSPINMDDQDRVKQERKRLRNREAARRCRSKKLEEIMLLEGRVKELKEQNRSLGDTATALRDLMNKLQSQISQHISRGCPMMMMPDSSSSP